MDRDKRTRPDITPVSKYPDLEKPGIHGIMQLLKLSLMTTRGDIIFRGASYVQRLAAGTEGQVPHYDANGEPVPGDIGDISGVLPATKVEVAELGTATYDDVQDYINFFGNRTILSGGALTDNGDGTVAMASCKAWCKESDSDTAVGKFFDFDGAASIALTDLTANIIYLDYNKTNGSATPQVVVATAPATHGFKQDHILVGVVYLDGTDAHVVQADFLGIQIANRSQMHEVEHHGPHRSSGAVTSATGTRNLSITAGVFYYGLNRKTILPFNTSRTGTADEDEANKLHDADADFAATDVGKDVHNVTDDTYGEISAFVNSGELTLAADTFPDGNEVHNVDWFSYWYYDGDASPSAIWVEVKGSTQISNSQYNDVDTGLVNFTANRFGVHWVYMDMDGKHIHIVYGQGDYKVNEAVEATVPSLLPNAVTKFGVLIAKIICQQGTDTLTIMYPWTTVFMSTLATDHGSLGGLDGDDHPQYIKDSEFAAAEDVLVGTGAGTFSPITLSAQKVLGMLTGGNTAAITIGIADNNMVQVDGTPVDTEVAVWTAAGLDSKSYAELLALLSSDTRAVFDFLEYQIPVNAGWSEVTNGSGTAAQRPTRLALYTGATTISNALAFTVPIGLHSQDQFINWNVGFTFICKFAVVHNDPANQESWLSFAQQQPLVLGDLTVRGIGINIKDSGGGTRRLYACSHDGTTYSETDTGEDLANATFYAIELIFTAGTSLVVKLDGATVATKTTNIPATTGNDSRWGPMTTRTGGAAAHQFDGLRMSKPVIFGAY